MKKGNSITNMTVNIMALGIGMIINLWLTPFIINEIGATSYGFIPLIQQMVNYMVVITMAINSMEGRYFTIASNKGDNENAEKYISTTLISSVAVSFILVIPLVVVTMYLDKIINIPLNLHSDVKIAMILCGVVFLTMNVSSSYGVATFKNKRFDLSSWVNILNQVIRAIVIILLFRIFKPNIWFINLANLLGCLVSFIANYFIFKKLEPNIRISLKNFDFNKLRDVLGSGIWMSINWIGSILFLQIDLLVSNKMLGALEAGKYAAVLQLPNLMRTLAGAIFPIFAPTIMEIYSKGDIKGLVKYSNRVVKLTGLLMALPIGLVCGLGGSLLGVWINPDFKQYQWLLVLMSIHLSINLGVQPLFSLQTALNKVKTPANVTIILGFFNFALAILFSGPLKLGAYGIALAGAIVLTGKNVIFTPIYNSIITKQPLTAYYSGIMKPLAATMAISVVGLLCQYMFNINNWFRLSLFGGIISFISLALFYLMFSKEEKEIIASYFRRMPVIKKMFKEVI